MNQRHARQPSQGRKVLRPAPLTQRKSYNAQTGHGHVHSNSAGQPLPSPRKATGPGSSYKVAAESTGSKDEDEESGMASFPQFCTTCERQIITPNPSILYCSADCRRRDSRPTSLHEIQTIQQSMQQHVIHSPPPTSLTHYFDQQPIPEIVPQRSPTVVRRPMSQAFSELSLSDTDDPSWDYESGVPMPCRDLEHTNYLEQYHSSFNQPTKSQRPRTKRTSTTSTGSRSGGDSSTNLPSLSHSPSSSYGTVASIASYKPVMKNPFSSTFTAKSVDLVIPYPTASTSPTQLLKDASLKSSASTSTSFRVAEASDTSYEVQSQGSRKHSRERADHTLKQLFSHDALKSSPKHG